MVYAGQRLRIGGSDDGESAGTTEGAGAGTEADAEAEARQAAALVESLCAEAETMKNYTSDEKDANTLPNPVANEKEPERFVQA